jgi:hypothetical protein
VGSAGRPAACDIGGLPPLKGGWGGNGRFLGLVQQRAEAPVQLGSAGGLLSCLVWVSLFT